MKIISIDSDREAILMADSAWRPHRRPYFVPDGPAPTAEIRPALRIDRLGKAINPKFANRYLGAWTPACFMRPAPGYNSLAPAGMLDDSLITGDWMEIPDGEIELESGGHTVPWKFDTDSSAALLASLSQAATFKTGDVILLPQVLLSFNPVAGNSFEIAIAGIKILEFNIR